MRKITYSIFRKNKIPNEQNLIPKTFLFSGGEEYVQLAPTKYLGASRIVIHAKLRDSADIMRLMMLKDALDREYRGARFDLEMGYIPYARQDRVCNKGEAFSSKVFANLINSLNFDGVSVVDPHSDVSVGMLNNIKNIETQADILIKITEIRSKVRRGILTLVAPDVGASKKTQEVAKRLGASSFIQATKERDIKTGELSGFRYYGDVRNKDLLIVDDICDGGGTFLGLAKILEKGGANSVSLYVTHGLFSRGLKSLISVMDTIYTTDTMTHELDKHDRLYILNL